MGVWYATREQLKAAPDIRESARRDAQLDRALESASRAAENLLHRRFYPQIRTQTFDWPNRSYARPWRLWLDQHELISVDTLTAGGIEIAAADFLLRPDDGPPFSRVEIDLGSTASFHTGATHQRAISITGLFGYRDDEEPAGALEAALNGSSTTVDVTSSLDAGVGAVLRAEDERMIVTAARMLDTTQNLGAGLTAQANDVTVPVDDGTGFDIGEVIQIDSEKMLVIEIAGNDLTVVRAWDGTVLASHSSGADVHAPRRLTVTRGALGTAAAAHNDATALTRWVPPGLVTDLVIAEAIVRVQQETAAYARTVGSGDNQREASGRGLAQIRADARATYGRKMRKRAV